MFHTTAEVESDKESMFLQMHFEWMPVEILVILAHIVLRFAKC